MLMTLNETFVWCAWEGEPFACSSRIRETYTADTKCYTVNAAMDHLPLLRAQGSGEEYALTLLVDIHQEENMHANMYSFVRYGAGVEMTVHASNTWPLTSEHGFVLAPGFSHYVATTYEEISRLNVDDAQRDVCVVRLGG